MRESLVRGISLRNALPGLLLVVLSLVLVLSYLDAVANGREQVLQRERRDILSQSEDLARSAQRDLATSPTNVASDLSVAACDLRTQVLALLDADARVSMAQRLAWQGRMATQTIEGFSAARFGKVVQGRIPDLQWDESGRKLSVMMPYFTAGDGSELRNLKRGVIYLSYDLRHEDAVVEHEAGFRLLPQLAVALLLMLVLGWLLRKGVSEPLARLQLASQRLATEAELSEPVSESGPREVVRLAQSFNDMAARVREAQAEVSSSKAQFEGLFLSAMDGIIMVDAHFNIQLMNRAAQQMFGCSGEQMRGEPIDRLLPERMRAGHAGLMQAFVRGAQTSRMMGRLGLVQGLRMNGEEFPVEASISHMQVQGKELLSVILRDVTERSRAQAELAALTASLEQQVEQRTARLRETATALEQQTQRLSAAHDEQRAIFDTATVGIAVTRDRVVLRCNRRLEQMFGYGQGELVGLSTRAWFIDEAEYLDIGEAIQTQLAGGKALAKQQEMVRKDGTRLWVRFSASELNFTGNEKVVLGVFEDVTLEYEASAALRQAKRLADDANRYKSAFLANMSHEIRTPMNAIIGMSYLVLKTDLSSRQRDYLRKIQGSSQHLLNIINDILDYSKIEAGRLELEHIEFDLEQVMENVSGLIAQKAAEKGLELVLEIDQAVPLRLVGDPLRLGQILVNYSNNAVKFTSRGEIHVRMELREETEQGVLLCGIVKDTGVGLTQAQIEPLFQSFQQADASTTRQYGGTGLGLAITRQLANLMQGDVGVSSEYGVGSRFWFTARLGRGAAAPRPRALSHDLHGKRVLVVDDNESARLLMADMLSALQLQVDQADSGAAALQAVSRAQADSRPYEILFLDWQMPGMNGIEVARQLQTLAPRPHVVLVTGYGREEVLKGAQQAGIEDVLIKPVNGSMLFDGVVRLLAAEPAQDHAQPSDLSAHALRSIRGARVLLVEDNDLNQEVASELLRDAGLVVDLAENGQAAVEKLQRGDYDIVFMDMQMPVMDGLAATRAIRSLPGFASLPIVAMTANAMQADREACSAAGMNDHVAKPIDPQDLCHSLLKWIRPRGAPAPAIGPAVVVQPMPELPRIEGLDSAAGLRRVLGRRDRYLSLLSRFMQGQQGFGPRLQAALQRGDLEGAERAAHTLKGVAATVGLASVQRAAEVLEAAIRESAARDRLDALTAACVGQLDPVLEQLQVHFSRAAAGPAQQGPAPLALTDLCRRLAELLAQDDMEAGDLLQDNAATLQSALGPAFAPLQAAVNAFDYEAGLSRLRAACESSGLHW